MKVLVMGLGLHGGGLESARFLLSRGVRLTVTDLRDEKTLAPSIERLEEYLRGTPGNCTIAGAYAPSMSQKIHYVLGRHETDDFKNADMVIKNPGVPSDSPFLKIARRIETDISLFLSESPARLIAVTGSKGKSSAASAIHWVLNSPRRIEDKLTPGKAYLGGNITVSPLTFLDDLKETDDVILELSSWQLGDLKGRKNANGGPLLKPKAAVITAIMPDHLDRYGSMEAYVDDKREIYRGQDSGDITVAKDDSWGRGFFAESLGRPLIYSQDPLPEGTSGGWIAGTDGPGFARLYGDWPGFASGETAELVPAQPLVPGYCQKQNLLAAGLALPGLGIPAETIRETLGSFPGVEHRLELFHKAGGIEFYNDSAATIPEAAAAAIEALGAGSRFNKGGLILVCGGADKNLDFSPLVQAASRAKALILLAGSGSEKLRPLLAGTGITFYGPFDSLDKTVAATLETAQPGDRVVLSPGCASFGMFLNEFDRGRQWKEAVKRMT